LGQPGELEHSQSSRNDVTMKPTVGHDETIWFGGCKIIKHIEVEKFKFNNSF
jgi:hypothetical protein